MSNINDKKEKILKEASQLLGEENDFSLEELSIRTGVSRVTLYRYFGGRDRLIEEVEKRFNIDGTGFKRDQLENRIIQAAENLFLKRGMFSVTLEDIADEAQVGIATLYRKFETRERLIEEFLAKSFIEEANFIFTMDNKPEVELKRFASTMLKTLESSGGLMKMALFELEGYPDFFKKIKKGQYRTLHQLSDYFGECMNQGALAKRDSFDLAASFMGMVMSFGFLMPRLYDYESKNTNETVDFIVSVFLKGAEHE
jgi:AcrR family transcriptional regulator